MYPQFQSINSDLLINGLPGLIFFKNLQFELIGCNNRFKQFVGFSDHDNFLGRNDYDLPWSNRADMYRDADMRVMNDKQSLAFLETIRLSNGNEIIALTRKSPLYDYSNEVIGLSGSISIISSPTLVRDISILTKTDFELISSSQYQPKTYSISDNFDHFNLSKQETICLFYLVRGKTAKEISQILNRSKRTIENHINSIKSKLNCQTKFEVTSKAIEYGFVHFIPSDFLINQM
ncbi:MAG: LuxR C-terminal-related transcriptional regulator [Gammaproteobacteria bacterium]